MSAAPESDPSKPTQRIKSCWSCRVVSGGGMIVAGAYVLVQARKLAQRAGPSTGTVVQLTFAACLAVWGVVIITEPMGKWNRKT